MQGTEGVKKLIERILPEHKQQIELKLQDDTKEFFEIEGEEGHILLKGSTLSALSSALGHYLKMDAKIHLSWCGCRIELPEKLPAPQKYKRVVEQKYRVYFNYCTFNYSAAWWDWDRWEKELDFMALNGINLPLSAVGIECTWYETLIELGFSEKEALTFFSGPAFLAWQWMTNIEGFCGPIPKSWIQKRRKLGKQIISRQIELGMTPIQQGFSGFVPRKLKEKMPETNIVIKKDWCGIEGTAQLDPTDPEFQRIGKIFLEKQRKLFGSYGYYAADPFHEGEPPQEGEEYLHAVGSAIYQLMQEFDPNSVWVMQGWTIYKGIITAVPQKNLLILDLEGEEYKKHENFWGYPFVAGNLHNFGGRIALHGDMALLAENVFYRIKEETGNIYGTGLFMEGIIQNPAYYDLAFEMLTREDKVNLDEWLEEYVIRRYGTKSEEWTAAWKILLRTVYGRGTNGVEKSSSLCARPAVNVKKSGPNDGFHLPYGNQRLLRALELLLEKESDSDGYQYDIADILRQILSNYGQKLYREVAEAFLNRKKETFVQKSRNFLKLIEDTDCLLSGRSEFSLKKWIQDARSWGDTQGEENYLEYCAKVLLTIWGSEKEPLIFDYSWREWAGMLKNFYCKRWQIFFEELEEKLEKGEEYEEDILPQVYGREAFRANEVYEKIADYEVGWINRHEKFEDTETDIVWEAKRLVKKYRLLI